MYDVNKVGLYGKIPVKSDFVKENVNDAVVLILAQWLEHGMQNLNLAGQQFPPLLVRYIFASSTANNVIVGVLAPSLDKVGRNFPVTIFSLLPCSDAARSLLAIPAAYESFLSSASMLIQEIPALGYEEIINRLYSLNSPTISQQFQSQQYGEQLLWNASGSDFISRLFGGLKDDSHYYAFNTFLIATSFASNNPGLKSPTVLDCPVAVDVDLLAWLQLTQETLKWDNRIPSIFWVGEPFPRLLIALGEAPSQLLHYLAEQDSNSSKLWPLLTNNTEAIKQASSNLKGVLGHVEHGSSGSIGNLIHILAQQRA